MGSVVIIGGTSGLGRELAAHYVQAGRQVVVTSRDPARANRVAAELGGAATGIAVDLAFPRTINSALAGLGPVQHLVLTAVERDDNRVADYSIAAASHLVTLKLVGYTEVVHTLLPRLDRDGSVLLFGGQARVRPYPGSTTATTVTGGIAALIGTLALELAPIRVNAIHPGTVGDSPHWLGNDDYLAEVRQHTATGRNVTMEDIVGASTFLLENRSVNAVNLAVDGGWR